MKEMSLIGGVGIGPRYLYPNLGYKPLSENVGVGEKNGGGEVFAGLNVL